MDVTKRVFFAMQVAAPWPDELPNGRMLDPSHRHLTLAFLGETDFPKLQAILPEFPPPPFKVGFAGRFDQCLFLPPRRAHVVAWHVTWLEDAAAILPYQKDLIAWLQLNDFNPDNRREFLPHVTICRQPFNPRAWEKQFKPLPMIVTDIHLYESIGGLRYEPVWSYPLKHPFEEFEHTADIAFRIRGASLEHIYRHAHVALAFKCPEMMSYLPQTLPLQNLDDVIMALNEAIARTDQNVGCPYKAVSFHGDIVQEEDGTYLWEMIVDV